MKYFYLCNCDILYILYCTFINIILMCNRRKLRNLWYMYVAAAICLFLGFLELSAHDLIINTVKHQIQDAQNPKTWIFLVSSCSCPCPCHLSQALSREWRCSWSSADRRCSNYIWVMNNFISCWGATYIRGLTISLSSVGWLCSSAWSDKHPV